MDNEAARVDLAAASDSGRSIQSQSVVTTANLCSALFRTSGSIDAMGPAEFKPAEVAVGQHSFARRRVKFSHKACLAFSAFRNNLPASADVDASVPGFAAANA